MGAGLFHTLNIGEHALHASRQGVDTASHNISNANVEGYSRQRVDVRSRTPLWMHGIVVGSGAYVKDITRSHNQFIEKQINRAHQLSGEANGRFEGLKTLETIFSPELASGVSDEITNFFNALQDLSLSPEDMSVRSAVRENARNLIGSFKRVDSEIRQRRLDLDDIVNQECSEINGRLKNIAGLNQQIQEMEVTPGAFANDLRDQRDLLLRELTEKVQINYYEDEFGNFCVRGPEDIILVDRNYVGQFTVSANEKNDGFADVVITDGEGGSKRNVTRMLDGGRLKGLIEVRDNVCKDIIDRNNDMAAKFTTRINEIHGKGYGIKNFDETTGRKFFKSVENLGTAARDLDISSDISDSLEAISVAGTPLAAGDNIVINEMLGLKSEKLMDGGNSNLIEYYSNYVGNLGVEINRTTHLKEANDLVVNDLQTQREAVSGVSLDEEAVSLMKWQSNFTASSKVITTVDEMLDTVLSLKR
jgi:flagellar hook-associated protein 1 FlgK